MWISGLGSFVQVLAAVWAFRASSHKFDDDQHRNRHLLGFSVLMSIGLLLSLGGLYANYRSQVNEKVVQSQRYGTQVQQNSDLKVQLAQVRSQLDQATRLLETDQEPTLSVEHVGYLPVPGNTEIIGITVRNVGKSPALHAHSFSALARYPPHSTDRPGLAYAEKDAVGDTDIPPQNVLGIPMPQHVSPNAIKEWENDMNVSTFLFGSVWFKNAENKEIEVPFCYKLVGDDFWQPITPKSCME